MYIPLNGAAVTVRFKIWNRTTGVLIDTYDISVFNYEEAYIDSEQNKTFTNIQDLLIKKYKGYKTWLSFDILNVGSLGTDNLVTILNILLFINAINISPDLYRMEIKARLPNYSGASYIYDAVFTGDKLSIKELSKSSNSAQSIHLEFTSKHTEQIANFMIDTTQMSFVENKMVLENDSIAGEMVTEDDESKSMITEIYNI